jgi:HlyD family secretion protein
MKRKKIRLLVVLLVIVVVGGVLWGTLGSSSAERDGTILTSGFIEATDVTISAETSGRIVEIAADEGDPVTAGAILVRLDDSLLLAQKRQAEANSNLARAYLEQAVIVQDGAKKAWQNALEVQRNPLELEARIIAAQGELETAELNLLREKEIESDLRVPSAEVRYDTAEKILENLEILKSLDWFSIYTMRKEIYPAEGELEMAELSLAYQKTLEELWSVPTAELRVVTAQKALENLLAIRDNPQELNAAVDSAYTAYQASTVAAEAAELQVEQAEASLDVINVQLDRLTMISPGSGVVASRHAEVGEIAQPGLPLLSIIELDEVTLTAYVPERKIGLVKLGQEAQISVDSYPDESFPGTITYISPNALFTPKNIQLKDEREKMVFAVKISLANPEQKLKPGMPADAQILTGLEDE